jgi:4-aminobutyrate--pyruvate transaminase
MGWTVVKALPNSLAGRDAASLIHPATDLRAHLEKGPTVIVGSEGCRIRDDSGRELIECLGGLWCCSLGFKQERLARAAYEQMRKLGFYHIYKSHSHEGAIELAEKLLQIAPVPMSKVQFQNSGSEANEAALKLCWYYHNAIGKPEKKKIIGRKGGFHGHTTGAASISGKSDTHGGFDLPFARFLHTGIPHYYRLHEAGEREEAFSARMADALEKLILAEGPETVAAFFAEPVMGASGGLIPPAGYFAAVQAVLQKYEILFVADEVITGFGRTGSWWASETFDLKPDIITSAKALSAGMIPISAVIVNERVFGAMVEMSDRLGGYAHGSTFSAHPVAAAVALETIRIMEEDDLIAHGREIGQRLLAALGRLDDHPMIADLKGVGPLVSMELVKDRRTRKGFPPEAQVNAVLTRHCTAQGVLPRLGGDRVVFAPPLVMTIEEADETVRRFVRALDDTWKDVRAA